MKRAAARSLSMTLLCVLAAGGLVSTTGCNKSRSGALEGDVSVDTSAADDANVDARTADVALDGLADVRLPDAEGCSGNAPFCVDACQDDLFQPSVCLVDTWACPPGTQPVDNCPSEPAPCTVVSTSEIGGVRIELLLDDCRVSRAEALESGVTLPYRVVVDDTLELSVAAFDEAPCVVPGGDGLQVLASLGGSGARYCACDLGRCGPPASAPVTLNAGIYDGALLWPGREWGGPSDFGAPLGDPFPFGTYVFEVQVPYLDGDGVARRVEARAAAVIQVVP